MSIKDFSLKCAYIETYIFIPHYNCCKGVGCQKRRQHQPAEEQFHFVASFCDVRQPPFDTSISKN